MRASTPNPAALRFGLLCLALLLPCALRAQSTTEIPQTETKEKAATPDADADGDIDAGVNGIIPAGRGFNLSLITTSQHDSSNGWSSVFNPDLAYRFNRLFSIDATVPVFYYLIDDVNVSTKALPVYRYETKNHAVGDTIVNFHLEAGTSWLDYDLTATLGIPTGDTFYGLGAGQATYAVTNHFEHSFGMFSPDIEIGSSDSSDLVDARTKRSYVSIGDLVLFQAGTTVQLPHYLNFDAEAYEQLAIGATTTYSTTGKGKKKVTTASTSGAAEDNGFNTILDVPLNPHVILSGFYSRSLRNKIDIAGFSLTFLSRAAPRARLEH